MTGSQPSTRSQPIESHPIDEPVEASTRTVLAVAERTETPVDELPPLYETIDPDALDRFVEGVRDRRGGADDTLPADPDPVTLRFEYAGCEIVVAGTALEVGPAGDGS